MNTFHWRTREIAWGLACAGLSLLAWLGPALPPHAFGGHGFADQRTWLGLPHAFDVLSNLPFAGFGLWGLRRLAWRQRRGPALPAATRWGAALFFAGLLLTALGSAYYHWQPDDARLAWDRAGMALAFAGLLGLATCERVSPRAGALTLAWALAAGLLAVAAWRLRGDLWPWAVVQFGGMLGVLLLLAWRPLAGALGVRLGLVVAVYALAKLLELSDHAVYALSGGGVSGHSLKHLVASLAAWPVLAALAPLPRYDRVDRGTHKHTKA